MGWDARMRPSVPLGWPGTWSKGQWDVLLIRGKWKVANPRLETQPRNQSGDQPGSCCSSSRESPYSDGPSPARSLLDLNLPECQCSQKLLRCAHLDTPLRIRTTHSFPTPHSTHQQMPLALLSEQTVNPTTPPQFLPSHLNPSCQSPETDASRTQVRGLTWWRSG